MTILREKTAEKKTGLGKYTCDFKNLGGSIAAALEILLMCFVLFKFENEERKDT